MAKNFLLSSEQKLERKLKEAILAIRIERAYSKDKILELYLNEIYLGIGSYGVAAAALNYFSKELSELSIEEAAYLAALPKAPNNYHPFRRARRRPSGATGSSTRWPRSATSRPRRPRTPRPSRSRSTSARSARRSTRPTTSPRKCGAAWSTCIGEDGLYGRAERTSIGDGRVNGGLSVRTTLDPNLQRMARRALIDGLVAFDRDKGWRGAAAEDRHRPATGALLLGGIEIPNDLQPWRLGVVLEAQRAKAVVGLRPPRQPDGSFVAEREAVEIPFDEMKWAKSTRGAPKAVTDVLNVGDVIWVAPKNPDQPTGVWSLMQVPEVGGGLVAMDPHTGRVHAVVGGFSFATSQFDRALQAKRQPGSSFKPLVYAAALDNGYKPTSIVLDAPIEIDQGPGKEIWQPKNYDGTKSFGPSTLRLGIEKSRNQMTVRLAQDMGMPLIVEYSKRFGVYDDLLPVLAMSLGAGETTLLKMVTAYAELANGGKQVTADADRSHPGPLGAHHLAPRQARVHGLQGGEVAGPGRAGADRRSQADHRPAHRLPDDLDHGGRGPARHRHHRQADHSQRADRRQDRHHQRREGRLVHRLHAGPRGRRLRRLRHAPAPGQGHATGGQVAAPIFANFLKTGAGRQEGGCRSAFRPASSWCASACAPGCARRAAEPDSVMEAFKPNEEPDDAYSVIGFTNDTGTFSAPDQFDSQRGLSAGRSVY